MDRDPQMAQMLTNPELLRENLNMMANPVSAVQCNWGWHVQLHSEAICGCCPQYTHAGRAGSPESTMCLCC